MYKKFLSAIILVFAFFFLNMSVDSFNIKADELPQEAYAKGEIKGYWAILNYGADYIGSREVVIDIQQEAIADEEVRFIAIAETEYSDRYVYYERFVNPQFSSKINYVMQNEEYGAKSLTILLLRELSDNPTDDMLVDKIYIKTEQKRNLSDVRPSDVLITKGVEDGTESLFPYDIHVTLNPATIEGVIEDYVFRSVKYKLLNNTESPTLNALNSGVNDYYFTVYRNGTYEVEIEDIFGYKVVTTVEVTNLRDPEIIIELRPEVTTPINRDYVVGVDVIFFETDHILNSNELSKLEVTYNGNTYSIKENMQFVVRDNGVYVIDAESINGSVTQIVFQADNIDKENPFAQVLPTMVVYTESLSTFTPENEIFVYDNVSLGENIKIELNYYTVIMVDGVPTINSGITSDVIAYLYSVRDIIIRYKVSDEAGNSVERDSYVQVIDNTRPTITFTTDRMDLYINDPYPTAQKIEREYGIIVSDNSLYEGSDREISYAIDFSEIPVDEFNRINRLGQFRVFISAVDAAGNTSESIALRVDVSERKVTIEADEGLYIVYGDPMIPITYHCIRELDDESTINVPCEEELLEGDSINGELYVLNPLYTGTYTIYYDGISIPSVLYSLHFGSVDTFTIKPRTIRVEAQHKEKDYLDEDPLLTYEISDVCSFGEERYIDYRCSLLSGDSFIGNIVRDMTSPSEDVWYDEDGKVLPRRIMQGTLDIFELVNGGVKNYVIDFVEAEFMIWPKEVHAYIDSKSKIYGENDPVYTLRECRGKPPIDGITPENCMSEVQIVLSRGVDGESVVISNEGVYIDHYEIVGTWYNMNYDVTFYNSYLTILRRDISISVLGDLINDSPTGKYTIYYEQDLPNIVVYDSSAGSNQGLANNTSLTVPLRDTFLYGEASIHTQDGEVIGEYISGIGNYIIRKGTIEIVDLNNINAENNYNITFNEGILEVIRREIWIRIIKDLSKIYGDEDAYFTESDLQEYGEYIILEANGRYIIEITATTLEGEEPYIPRDNERMRYHLDREEGIYVGLYDIYIEELEGCENYDVNLYENYEYEILQRDMYIDIHSQTIIYRDIPNTFTYDVIKAEANLQYEDALIGLPEVEEYRHVGRYVISRGTIIIVDPTTRDVSVNYNFIVNNGILTVIQREIMIEVSEGQSKEYGDNDPVLLFNIYHGGVREEIAEDDYTGSLGREEGEIPGRSYEVNMGTLEITLNGIDSNGNNIGNYLIVEFNNTNYFYIAKRTITVTARDVTAIYGNEYYNNIVYDTGGSKLAFNLILEIEGEPIHDILSGDLRIIGEVDGVGTYVISCDDIRIIRRYGGEDVTERFYNFSYENGTLTILPREIRIIPDDGQSKTYGESDTGITYTYSPSLLMPSDEFSGELMRTPRIINDREVTEDIGEYGINLGTLTINKNYDLILDGSRTFVINPRPLNVSAVSLTIYYGDEFTLEYRIENEGVPGYGLANNTSLGIADTIRGELKLDPRYTGAGTYRITGDDLRVDNQSNYSYTFSPGYLIVYKRIVTVTPSEATLSKIYGERDPDYFEFTLDTPAAYTGQLIRERGEDVGRYLISLGTLNFGDNYEVVLTNAYFTINARAIEVRAENAGKIYGTIDPVLRYVYSGTLIGEDKFYGSLTREEGEEEGEYSILQGTLALTNNYSIAYTPGVFTIRYAEFTEIIIYSLTNNQYQIKGEEEEVRLYARFNEGADETHLGDVTWSVIKNETLEWEFSKDANNVISFTPSGSLGTYRVSASYGGKTGIYEVIVADSISGDIRINYVGVPGRTTQTLGNPLEIVYEVTVPLQVSSDAYVHWIINDTTIQINRIGDTPYFAYLPNLDRGIYEVQAKIGNKTSNTLIFTILNNNPPVITLNGESVVYIEARTSVDYIEQGAVVMDDIDGDITDSLVITGRVDTNTKGRYFIKYDARDSHGNNAVSIYRQVVVRDTTPPVITLNGNSVITLLYGQPYVEYGATAIDNYDGEVRVTIDNKLNMERTGIQEVIYTADDSAGNRGSVIRYVEIIDDVAPLITLIGDEVVYVEVNEEYNDLGALVVDNVDGRFIIPYNQVFYGEREVSSLDTSILGTYYVRYDYTDTFGNVGAGQIRTVIVRDSTPPVITLRGTNPYIIRYSYPTINYVEPGARVSDNYDRNLQATITGELGNELGTYYLYYNAVDSNGNIAQEVVRQIIVVDIENPILHFYDVCPQYMTIEALYEEYDVRCNAPGYGIWVEDDYQADIEELQKRIVVSGSVDNTTVGTYIISYNVTDMAGNSAVTLNRYVMVVDTTAPVITLNGGEEDGSLVVEVFEEYIELGATVYDRYDEYHELEVEIRINHNINVNRLGEYIVTYNATDSNGNAALPVIRRVSVKDTTPPVITIIGDNPMTVERGLNYREQGATAIDNYDGPMSNISINNAPSGMRLGTYEVVYRAIDSSGNIGEAIRVVNVVDTIPPVVLGVEDGVYYKNPVSIYFVPTLGTDEVLTGWLNDEIITSPYYLEEEGTYDLLVRDDAGNETRIWFAIDTTAPLILGIRNGEYTNKEVVDIYSNEELKYYEYRYQSGNWVRINEQTVSFTVEGIYRIYAVDMADNVSTVVTFVIDRTPPAFTLSGVINKGITNSDVYLTVEEGASVVVNSHYNIPTIYSFTSNGYYHVTLRDVAGNTVILQFVINKDQYVTVNNRIIGIISQHNAIDTISIAGTNYPRNSGYMVVIPLIEGGFTYVTGKLFSEAEYQRLMAGETVEFGVSSSDDTFMFAAFVVNAEELNKFETQTVDDDDNSGNNLVYIGLFIFIIAIFLFFFIFFLKRRRKEEDEEEEETTMFTDY